MQDQSLWRGICLHVVPFLRSKGLQHGGVYNGVEPYSLRELKFIGMASYRFFYLVGPNPFLGKRPVVPALTVRFRLSINTQSPAANYHDLSKVSSERRLLILFRVSRICACIVVILSSHSSAAGDAVSSLSLSSDLDRCIVLGSKP